MTAIDSGMPILTLGALLLAAGGPAAAQDRYADLAALSLEELGNIEIISVSKQPERLADAAASVYVITADDIRHSGATTLPEVLRLAPNLHVARQNGDAYAISARGMNGSNNTAANKLLVMIDGRSVYTPLFSGVFWDAQMVMLEDIARVEVVSGPGGTLWGLNAVNGVINVITRNAADTHGQLLALGVSGDERNAAMRHGGALGSGSYRVFGQYRHRSATDTDAGTPIDDAGRMAQLGFRVDREHGSDRWSLHGHAYEGWQGQPEPGLISVSGMDLALDDVQLSGLNLGAHWDRSLANGGALALELYLDRTEREVPPTFSEQLDILDLQWQHTLAPIGAHRLAWGSNVRFSHDRIDNLGPVFAFLPQRIEQKWFSLYVQDDWTPHTDWRVTAGTRFEYNEYTGVEVLPNLRVAWSLGSNRLLWAAASRAVRAPSRLDRDAFIPAQPPFLLAGGEVRSEIAEVYEIGYRVQPTDVLSYSLTAFHADYDHLQTAEIDPGGTFIRFGSGMRGSVAGLEWWGALQAREGWRLSAGFTALHSRRELKPGSNDVAAPQSAGNDPSNLWQLRSSWNIGNRGEFDLTVRHVGELRNLDVPDYTVLDARLAWRWEPDIEWSLSARNLFDQHAEYGDVAFRSQFEPSVYAKLLWTF